MNLNLKCGGGPLPSSTPWPRTPPTSAHPSTCPLTARQLSSVGKHDLGGCGGGGGMGGRVGRGGEGGRGAARITKEWDD